MRSGTSDYDIWSATGSLDGPFDMIEARSELNSDFVDWDPWISADGRTIFFGSNRAGTQDIYQASR